MTHTSCDSDRVIDNEPLAQDNAHPQRSGQCPAYFADIDCDEDL